MRIGLRARGATIVVILVGLVFAFGFPIRSYLDQRREIRVAEAHLVVLRHQNDALHREAQRLSSDAEVERLARSLYNLVKPGEQAYAVVPTAPPAPAPASAPRLAQRSPAVATTGHDHHTAAAWYTRMWHSIAGFL